MLLKVSWFRKGLWGRRFPPKNERMNSFLLVCELFSFVFWRKSTTSKNLRNQLTFRLITNFKNCSTLVFCFKKFSDLLWEVVLANAKNFGKCAYNFFLLYFIINTMWQYIFGSSHFCHILWGQGKCGSAIESQEDISCS